MVNHKTIDWSKQDIVLAEENGISRERIRQLRKSLNKPKSLKHRQKRNSEGYNMNWSQVDWTMSNSKIGRLFGMSSEIVRLKRNTLNIPPFVYPTKVNWRYIDWSASNKAICEKYGVSLISVYRWRQKLNKPNENRYKRG